MDKHRYVFLGPQGSGKGTQASKLAEFLSVDHVSTGELFREAVNAGTPLGKAVQSLMATGEMISDETTNQLVTGEFIRRNLTEAYILDGYPRNMNQVQHLESLASPRKVILLDLSDDDAVSRISGRLVCTRCRTIYHKRYNKPKKRNVCDSCAGQLVTREDDTEATVRARLQQYHEETEPLIAFYEAQERLVRIDAKPDIDEIEEQIRNVVTV